jgi:hypothetical protein
MYNERMGRTILHRSGLLAVTGAAVMGCSGLVFAAWAGGTWGPARGIPGMATANMFSTRILTVSCASAGNCAVGGYSDATDRPLIASERNGTWDAPRYIAWPHGVPAANFGHVDSVSCGAAGNCSAGGAYLSGESGMPFSAPSQAFVVSESGGRWATAVAVPGLAARDAGGAADTTSVSCASAGNCAAGGSFQGRLSALEPFVVSETKGTWRKAVVLRVPAAAENQGVDGITAVSCSSPGNCVAIGPAFLASENNGTWGAARVIPGLQAPDSALNGGADSVSCPSAGNCVIGGTTDRGTQGFTVTERHGTWGAARPLKGADLREPNILGTVLVSCASAGRCVAGASFHGFSGQGPAFVATETNRHWGTARPVPGLAALSKTRSASVTSTSCSAQGLCAVGGSFTSRAGRLRAFVVTSRSGTWGTAQLIPDLAARTKSGNSQVRSLSCVSATYCAAAGWYAPGFLDHVFVTER